MRTLLTVLILCLLLGSVSTAAWAEEIVRVFRVKYVAVDAIYLDAGSEEGLSEGWSLM